MRLFIGLFLLLSSIAAKAQDNLVKGFVYDLEDHKAIAGAVVKMDDENTYTITNAAGYFELNPTSGGKLTISMLGYHSEKINYRMYDDLIVHLKPDTQALGEVVISAFGNKRNKDTAGAISVLDGAALKQGSGISLQSGLNSIPGVQMDQSTPGEARVSIRGSGVRSPWGIRNVKIYLNDIPLTEADGTSRIEGIAVNDLGRAEVIRGPASSIYGSGTGGVINFKLERAPYNEHSLETTGLLGSFGLKRSALIYKNSTEKMNAYISYGWQQYDGYREHSFDKRNFLAANLQFFPSEKQTVTLLLNRTSQNTEIPGTLTKTEMENDRTQASAGNLDKQAGRIQNWTRVGVGHRYHFNEDFSNSTSVFTYFYDIDHPLAYAYIRNYYQSFGGRTRFDYNFDIGNLPSKILLGAEFMQADSKGTQYENVHGTEGNIRSNVDYKDLVYTVFLQVESEIWNNGRLTLGTSFNNTSYDATDYLIPEKSGLKKFDPTFTPRVALSHDFGYFLSLHGSVSTGFYAPTHSEIQNVDGSINKDLQAEKAINFEVNAKGHFLNSKLGYDLAVFKMNMKDELIGRAVAQGVTVYHNSGKTDHSGIELALNYAAITAEENKFISDLNFSTAVTYSNFKFKDYKLIGNDGIIISDYSENAITGVAPWSFNTQANLQTTSGIYADVYFYFNDRFPLNDLNTDFNASYNFLNGRIGYRGNIVNQLIMNVYAGVDNMTNAKYSSHTSLNAVGYNGAEPAYFNPSPTVNFYAGLGIKYEFRKK